MLPPPPDLTRATRTHQPDKYKLQICGGSIEVPPFVPRVVTAVDTEDVIKVEVWDVVDRATLATTTTASNPTASEPHGSRATNSGLLTVLDATSINVYKHANGVIFLFDPTNASTIDYVARGLAAVPRDLPVLIIGNFADKTPQSDQSLLHRQFEAIRGETQSSAPLHSIAGSLVFPACSTNPPSGLLPAILKFFELPFLQLQHCILTIKLKINEEQVQKARAEWDHLLCPPSHAHAPPSESTLAYPEATRTTGNAGQLDLPSTDTLTLASRKAWNEPPSLCDSWALSPHLPDNKRSS